MAMWSLIRKKEIGGESGSIIRSPKREQNSFQRKKRNGRCSPYLLTRLLAVSHMPLFKVHEFLNDVLFYVKFPFGKNDIRLELENHILDKIDEYEEEGYDRETAEQLAINDMGDSEEIGRELNKEHNPFLGWVLVVSNVLVGIFLMLSIVVVVFPVIGNLGGRNLVSQIPKEDIAYQIDIDETIKIDDTVIHFTNVIYEKNQVMNIFYEYYDTRLWGTGWSIGGLGEIKDNLGNTYFAGSGSNTGGFKTKAWRSVENFSKDADTLIIDYDFYNRKHRVEIPLKVGDVSD